MDLTHPFSFLARLFPACLFVAAAPARPDSAPDADAGETAAPANLHADLGLPPADAAPPDAQSLRHAMTMWIG